MSSLGIIIGYNTNTFAPMAAENALAEIRLAFFPSPNDFGRRRRGPPSGNDTKAPGTMRNASCTVDDGTLRACGCLSEREGHPNVVPDTVTPAPPRYNG